MMQIADTTVPVVSTLVGALLALASVKMWAVHRPTRAEAADELPTVGQAEPDRQQDEDYAKVLRRLSSLEIALEQLQTRMTNLSDTQDERYRRLSARIRSEQAAAQPDAEEDPGQLSIFRAPPQQPAAAPSAAGQRRPLIPRR